MKLISLILLNLTIFNAQASGNFCLDNYGKEFRTLTNQSLSKQSSDAYKNEIIKILARDGIVITADNIDLDIRASASYIYKSKNFYSHQFYFEVPETINVHVNGKLITFTMQTWYEDDWISAPGAGNLNPKIIYDLNGNEVGKECSFSVAYYDSMNSLIFNAAGKSVGFVNAGVVAEFKKAVPK